MNIKVLLLILIQFCFVSTTQIDVPVSFRRMGYYATGLSHAHLKTNINIENVRKLNDQAKAVINSTAKNAADLTDDTTLCKTRKIAHSKYQLNRCYNLNLCGRK